MGRFVERLPGGRGFVALHLAQDPKRDDFEDRTHG
jgi:hypothetical protein